MALWGFGAKCLSGWVTGYPLDCYDYLSTCGANKILQYSQFLQCRHCLTEHSSVCVFFCKYLPFWKGCEKEDFGLGVFDTLSDSIQCLNFAKTKRFIQYLIQFKILFNSKKNSADSIQKIIQFNSQGIINTGRMGKLPKNCLKSVQNRQKRGFFIKNGKYRFKI